MPDETELPPIVTLDVDEGGAWIPEDMATIQQATLDVARAIARELNRDLEQVMRIMDRVDPDRRRRRRAAIEPPSPEAIFLKTYGDPVSFRRRSKTATQFFGREDGAWGFCQSRKQIFIFKNAPAFRPGRSSVSQTPEFSVHELGHAFENAVAAGIAAATGTGVKRGRNSLTRDLYDNRRGFSQKRGFQQSKTFGSDQSGRGEIFADMFIGWVYQEWETIDGILTADGQARKAFMDRIMLSLIEDAMQQGDA